MLKGKKNLKFPNHVAFIMDGNRRWATRRGLNKMIGHKQGAIALKNIIKVLVNLKEIKFASFFAFSTENWNREQKEIDYIFDLAYNLVEENEEIFKKDNIKFVAMGDVSRFPDKLKNLLVRMMDETKTNTGLVVNLGMNYGGRDDIVHAANLVAENGEKITIENLKANLYSAPAPDIDLLVRTSGEERISNFMLFQLAYSELYFTKTCWPAFNEKQLMKALREYSKRNRTFGGNK
ncbi:MAG: di-trans,poly-cis-decaprenylcistransferase [Clostridia bacterium]|nr:di-trans,poly-cis-decaprenylcistransferase [Clostridia bacterium]